jgi:hypothetical protein
MLSSRDETLDNNNDADTFVVDFNIENKSKVMIVAKDKDKLERIKRTLLFCIKMSSTEGGVHKLKFTIQEAPKSFLSRSASNKLIMEGDIPQGLEYLKKFLSNEKYAQAVEKFRSFDEKRVINHSVKIC